MAPAGLEEGSAPSSAPSMEGERYDFHSHTLLTDGSAMPIDMWHHAVLLGHRALAITDHLYGEDPRPMMTRLLADQEAFGSGGLTTLVGVEVSMLRPDRIAAAAKAARKAGAQIVIVHGETPVEPVPPGTNRAAIESNEVDLLAHPGLLSEPEAELARAHDVILELSSRRGHGLGNGIVAVRALAAGAQLVVDSDAHSAHDLIRQEFARKVALGAGVPVSQVERVITETPQKLLKRLGRA
ncbi:MAG: histidinol phosphate phosphatase domain-containing protein [Euryarchaeota archaeon]|nr:histidinol phosphate phosphatase domain-containing protein [Euryarchaeota archaeon]